MAKLATPARDSMVEAVFEYCAIAALLVLVAMVGTHGFSAQLGIVFNNASRLAE